MEKKTKGQMGAWRRFTGLWAGIITSIAILLDGFEWYEISDWRVLLVGGVFSSILLIAGLAKDVTEIIKGQLK